MLSISGGFWVLIRAPGWFKMKVLSGSCKLEKTVQETRGYDLSQYAEELPLCEAIGSVWVYNIASTLSNRRPMKQTCLGSINLLYKHSSHVGSFRHLVEPKMDGVTPGTGILIDQFQDNLPPPGSFNCCLSCEASVFLETMIPLMPSNRRSLCLYWCPFTYHFIYCIHTDLRYIHEFAYIDIHPGRSTRNLKMMLWKMMFLYNWVIFRFHVLGLP